MSTLLRAAVALFISLAAPASSFAQDLRPAEAARYLGETVTVTGKVTGVHYDSRSGNTFINMGGRYPNHTFYGIIFRSSASNFQGIKSLDGATVSLSGTVKDYRGKPQIVLSSPSQIVVH